VNAFDLLIVSAFVAVCAGILYGTYRALRRRIVDGSRVSIRAGLVAALIAFAVVVPLSYWIAWTGVETRQSVAIGGRMQYNMPGRYAAIRQALREYADHHGHYPDSLRDVIDPANLDAAKDPWGHIFQYLKTDKGFVVRSLGRDGKPGGAGLDADFDLGSQDYRGVAITFPQFLITGTESLTLLLIALFAAICAGVASFITAATPRRRPMKLSLALPCVVVPVSLAALLLAALLMAIFLIGIRM
jgi:general secretion pathway protein G